MSWTQRFDRGIVPRMHASLVARLRSVGASDTLGGRLRFVRQIGAGGMGRVHEAVDQASGRRLAVKLVESASGGGALARFTMEAEILESLHHPAIVAYVDHGTTPDGELYLAMEWLDGVDLDRRLARGPLTVAEAVALGRRLAGGLAAAHDIGIVHRDLKPGNIVLVGDDVARATLVDFGIARRRGDDRLTRTGQLVGTPGYMAPEQVRGRRDVGPRADLFALGCVLYRCIAGRDPFQGEDLMTILARLLLDEPIALRAICADVPAGLDRLVARLLAKDEADRPTGATEVDAALAAIAEALGRADAGIESGHGGARDRSRIADARLRRHRPQRRRAAPLRPVHREVPPRRRHGGRPPCSTGATRAPRR